MKLDGKLWIDLSQKSVSADVHVLLGDAKWQQKFFSEGFKVFDRVPPKYQSKICDFHFMRFNLTMSRKQGQEELLKCVCYILVLFSRKAKENVFSFCTFPFITEELDNMKSIFFPLLYSGT